MKLGKKQNEETAITVIEFEGKFDVHLRTETPASMLPVIQF